MTTASFSWRVRALPLALFTAWACSSAERELFEEKPGSASFAIVGIDAGVIALEYVLRNNAGAVLESESLSPDPAGSIQFSLDLPAAERYSIILTARTADGQSCTGASEFDVSPSARVDVAVELQCSGGPGASVTGTLVSCPSVGIGDESPRRIHSPVISDPDDFDPKVLASIQNRRVVCGLVRKGC